MKTDKYVVPEDVRVIGAAMSASVPPANKKEKDDAVSGLDLRDFAEAFGSLFRLSSPLATIKKEGKKKVVNPKVRPSKIVSGDHEKIIQKRIMHLRNLMQEQIFPLIPFEHTIIVSWKGGKYYVAIRAKEKVFIEIKGEQTGKIFYTFEKIRDFFKDYSPSATYQFAVNGRSDRHDAKISFWPEIVMSVKIELCDEKVVQRFQTALTIFNNITSKEDEDAE